WNIWGRKYTLWALLESYDLTGEKELLQAGVRMADHLMGQLKRLDKELAETGSFAGLPSMSILKPMVMLGERTGERRFLDFAREIVEDNDRADGRKPNLIANAFSGKPVHEWYPSPDKWAKAYEMMSVLEGFLAYAKASGEKRPLEAAERTWEMLDKYERNAVCSVGYHDHFLGTASYPNAITESCDVLHWMRLCKYLYAATGRMCYLDAWEAAFLNAFLAGVFRDGAWGTHDVRSHGRRHLQGIFEVNMIYHFCCLDNDPRGFFDWAECQVASSDGRIDVNFYTDASFAGEDVSVKIAGNYPVGDEVRILVSAESPRMVRFRIPAWCRGGMRIDGRTVASGASAETVKMTGKSHEFIVKFDMSPRIERMALHAITGADLTEPTRRLSDIAWASQVLYDDSYDRDWQWSMRDKQGTNRWYAVHWRSDCKWCQKVSAKNRKKYHGKYSGLKEHVQKFTACRTCAALDVEDVMKLVKTVQYDEELSVSGFKVVFRPVEHLPGSAAIYFDDGKTTFAFSGDLGTSRSRLANPIRPSTKVDSVFVECTYGDKSKGDAKDAEKEYARFSD
ncbi:MAG: glycoside hydrolase family 127 protein, partial [Kiritimatiellae bacterium]|nr:glycoside hydrolase family 127 protein [Kiritimatiellia bacterium]